MVGAIALMATLTNGSPMAKAYKAAFLVIVLGCLAILATPDDPSTVAVMVFVGAMAIMVVGMALLFNLAHRAASPSPPIVACGAACFIGGDIAFRVIDRIVFSALPVTATPSFHFALLSALVVVTYAAVFTEHDLARVEKLEHVATNVAPDVGVHEVLGSRYGLTKREVEVLKYLVSGRSSRRIQEELFISESTVHTHIRHIYQKLGVHSKQELLDLADDVQRS